MKLLINHLYCICTYRHLLCNTVSGRVRTDFRRSVQTAYSCKFRQCGGSALKLKVRDALLEYTDMLFDKAADSDEAENIARENLKTLQTVAQNVVYENGYDYKVNAQVVKMYFNTRYYDNYTMPAGIYDALRITVGDGKGHNWWCVMYPSICISSAVDTDEKVEKTFSENQQEIVKGNDYQYKFKVVEIFEKIVSFFE